MLSCSLNKVLKRQPTYESSDFEIQVKISQCRQRHSIGETHHRTLVTSIKIKERYAAMVLEHSDDVVFSNEVGGISYCEYNMTIGGGGQT
jgi:hypothetical protein